MEQVCVERACGKTFEITDEEQQFFKDKAMCIPKRCADCRARRKQEQIEREKAMGT